MGVVSLMGYAGVTEGFLCAHPNVIVIVFKGRVKQDLDGNDYFFFGVGSKNKGKQKQEFKR